MDRIYFKINGLEYSVGGEVSSDVSLLDYIRNRAELRGTKYMCRQAGCGACLVAAKKQPGDNVEAVNSCMVSVTSCQDWEVTTIEELGNRKKGYHPIQKALAVHNGSQCGYCSVGWVMSMYCLLGKKKDLSMLEIEKSFASNICRCTGYRPILEAFKTFAKDYPGSDLPDIEDLNICEKTGQMCSKNCSDDEDWCIVMKSDVIKDPIKAVKLKDGRKWYSVNELTDVYKIFETEGVESYMLIGGNTAKGAYPLLEYPAVLIDISRVAQLKSHILDQNLIIGSGVTLTELLKIYQDMSENIGFSYLNEFYDHLLLVAHIAVRNLGTIAGNLMLKHQHNDFQSDLYLMFETVGAQLTILNNRYAQVSVTMEEFLQTNMKGAIILNVKLPPLSEDTKVKTFKVMPRAQNAHAIVNFGCLYEYSSKNNKVRQCRLVFGGLSPGFTRAKATERRIIGKTLFTNNNLQLSIMTLQNELVVTEMPPEPSAAYRKKLAIGLFYKSLLSLCPEHILNKRYMSGAIKLHETRALSKAKRTFPTKPKLWPMTQPIPKLESLIQCAGEAFYTEDVPTLPREVFGDLVLSTVPKGIIKSIDSKAALKYPGVIAVYTAKDIPGLNSFTPNDAEAYQRDEEVLCSRIVKYHSQPLAIVVAETRHIAQVAVKLVKVTYSNISKPVIDVREAKKDPKRVTLQKRIDATKKGKNICKVIKGCNTIHGQYHFTIETISTVVRPTEEGLEVFLTSQWPDGAQTMIARALNMDANRIDVYVRRIGGGFGLKLSRSILIAVAASLVVIKLNRPCRFIQTMETVSQAFGKRFPCTSDYEFAVDECGVIQSAVLNVFEDNGHTVNEKLSRLGNDVYYNCYLREAWDYQCYDVITDTAKNTWFRSPGTLECLAMTEMAMEHICYAVSLDPVRFRLANLDPQYNSIKEMLDLLIADSDYYERRAEVDKFNCEHRWKKRGLRFVPMKWDVAPPRQFDVNVSVYHVDGSVAICHGGIELGQGMHTRAAQVCGHFLNIPLDKIQVKATTTICSPNGGETGGSTTSQNIGLGVSRACKELLARLEPTKKKMNNPSWEDLIEQAFNDGVDLQAHGFINQDDITQYNVYGVVFAEVEIDVLTGELEVRRVDIIEDAGQSVSPELDIGQVEGAFIMGLGYWTKEKLIYNEHTGELLTNRPWNYYVPQALDIPEDFRVHLRKNSYSTPTALGSKVAAEAPMCTTIVLAFAIREAITASRFDSGIPTTTWFPFDGPTTVEFTCLSTNTRLEEMKFY